MLEPKFDPEKLKRVMFERGHSYREAQKISGISAGRLYAYCHYQESPSFRNLLRIAQSYRKPVEFFLLKSILVSE